MNIYGYARVSTSRQQREGNSLEDQSNIIHATYPSATIISEQYSGAKTTRPKFNRLLNTLQEGDTLVVTKLDRFCRSTKEGLEYIDTLKRKGVRIHIINMGIIDNTPVGNMLVTVLLAFAEFERSMILERTRAGLEVAKQRPDFKNGRPRMKPPTTPRNENESIVDYCKRVGISRSAYYTHIDVK